LATGRNFDSTKQQIKAIGRTVGSAGGGTPGQWEAYDEKLQVFPSPSAPIDTADGRLPGQDRRLSRCDGSECTAAPGNWRTPSTEPRASKARARRDARELFRHLRIQRIEDMGKELALQLNNILRPANKAERHGARLGRHDRFHRPARIRRHRALYKIVGSVPGTPHDRST